MLSQAQRTTILELSAQGVSQHEIARMLGISRLSVRKVVRSNSTAVPEIPRAEKAEPYRQRILELFNTCKENLVRVHEELTAEGAALSYPALTAFCRKQGKRSVYVSVRAISSICATRLNASPKHSRPRVLPRTGTSYSVPRAFGADDKKSPRTPSAWMISP